MYYLKPQEKEFRSTQGKDNYLDKRVGDSPELLDRIDDLKEELGEEISV